MNVYIYFCEFFSTSFYYIKYSYLIQIICKHLTHRWDSNKCYHVGSKWTPGVRAVKGFFIYHRTPELDPHHHKDILRTALFLVVQSLTSLIWWATFFFFLFSFGKQISILIFSIIIIIIVVVVVVVVVHSLRVFHISFSWWFFTGVWVTASHLKPPGFFSVFWPFLTML